MKIQKKTGLRVFDLAFIRSKKPCYNPNKHLPESWRGTALDILNLEDVFEGDRLWAVLHTELISERLMRLFAVWCYRQTLIFLPNQDPRCINAADVAEAYANGKATKKELLSANASIYYYAYNSIGTATNVESAAASAAVASTSYNPSIGAFSASNACANVNACIGAFSASINSYVAHAFAASAYASAQAEKRTRVKQVEKLSEMILAEGKERLALRKKKRNG